ncbi:MAG: hypothetical protein ISR83_02635 [Candidatus Marinimicrobia bacterium]|nr:hypothetical protein [Candidatus Neomarinimicrobiota bacterium]
MSSIYKKGRDGYYYYQTYVYNPETGKKNKRIFHSLNTKEMTEAQIQQVELDNKYQNESLSTPNSLLSGLSTGKNKIIILIGVVIVLIYLNPFKSSPIKQKRPLNEKSLKSSNIEHEKTSEDSKNTVINKIPEKSRVETIDASIAEVSPEVKKVIKAIPTIPEYKVIKIDRLSDTFKQGKIHVTVDKKSSKEDMHLLCTHLKDKYPEFSNIVICLYTNTPVGIELAKGQKSTFSLQKQKKAWLVMYTYNPVEGEYFDNYPGRQISSY